MCVYIYGVLRTYILHACPSSYKRTGMNMESNRREDKKRVDVTDDTKGKSKGKVEKEGRKKECRNVMSKRKVGKEYRK